MQKPDYLEDNIFIFFTKQQVEYFEEPLNKLEEKIKDGLQQNPQEVSLMQIKSQILYKYQLKFEESLSICKEILKLEPQNIDSRLDLVLIILYKYKNLYHSCQQILDECSQLDKQYWRIYYVQSIFYLFEGRQKKCLYFLNQHHSQFFGNKWISIVIAQLTCKVPTQKERAKILLNDVIQQKPFDYEILLRISYVQQRLKLCEEADKVLHHSIVLNPQCSKGYNNLGYLQRSVNGNYDECIKWCLKAIEFDENYDDSYFNLGIAYNFLQDHQKSYSYFKLCFQKNKIYMDALEQIIYKAYNSFNNVEESIYYSLKYIKQFQSNSYGRQFYSYIYRFNSYLKKDLEFLEISQHILLDQTNFDSQDDLELYGYESSTLNYFLKSS